MFERDWQVEPDYDAHIVALMRADLDDVFPPVEELEAHDVACT